MTLWWFDFKTWLTGSYRGTPRERWGYWKYRAQVALGLREPTKMEDWKFETETELEGWHSEEVEDELVDHFKKTGLLEAQRAKLTDDFLVFMNFVYPHNEISVECEWVLVDGQTICKYDFPERAKELARHCIIALDAECEAYLYYHEIFDRHGLKRISSKEEVETRMKQLKRPHWRADGGP